MGLMKELSIIQHNERMELNGMILKYFDVPFCADCLEPFTEKNLQTTDDTMLCENCYIGYEE